MRKSKKELRDEAVLSIGEVMKRLITSSKSVLELDLEREGTTLAQLRMLRALHDMPDISSADLARHCAVTPQSMQVIVARAERSGLIVRKPSADNRRVLTASLTAAGRRVHARGQILITELMREVWTDAKSSELEAVRRALSTAASRVQLRLDALHARNPEADTRAGSGERA